MTQKHYEGLVISVETQIATLPNGTSGTFEIVRHPGGAAVVAMDDQHRICLLRQYRVVAQDWLWELPAGKLEPPEAPLRTAQRELEEEAGIIAASWQLLAPVFSSPGVFDEVIYLYLARDLQRVPTAHEVHELIEVHWIGLDELRRWIAEGKIRDGKTLSGLCLAMNLPDLDQFKS